MSRSIRRAAARRFNSARRAGVALATLGVVLGASLFAVAGPAATASAGAPAPGIGISPLTQDKDVTDTDGEVPVVGVDLALKAGEYRKITGFMMATMVTTTQWNMDDTSTLRCTSDSAGLHQVGIPATAQTGIQPNETKVLRPSLLFRAPTSGTYHCFLLAQTGSTDHPIMTVRKGQTFLQVSAGDEVGSRMWRNPHVRHRGNTVYCTYLGRSGRPAQKWLLQDDGTVDEGGTLLTPWTASFDTSAITVTANVELTTCGHTASCGSIPHGDDSDSTVSSFLDVIQLDAQGNTCRETHTGAQTDVITIRQHHYNIVYSLPNVPVVDTCGSTKFRVRVSMRWVSGNVVKIDGIRTDPLTHTNAVAVNSAYTYPALSKPTLSGGKMTLKWTDQSSKEDAFAVFRISPDGTTLSELADLPTPNKEGKSETITFVDNTPSNVPNSQCYEVVAYDYNAVWRGADSDIVCA